MSGAQLRSTLKRLGLRYVDLAWMMGTTQRTVKRWIDDKAPIPQSAYLMLLALSQNRITPIWLRRHISEPIPYTSLGVM